jgi:hypothetical protein
LADHQVQKATDLALTVRLGSGLLDATDEQHLAIGIAQHRHISISERLNEGGMQRLPETAPK